MPTRRLLAAAAAASLALAAADGASGAAVEVFPGHPRLIVGGVRGVPVSDLRAACRRPELAEACARIGGRHVLDDAMRYLLADDLDAAARAEAHLRAMPDCSALGDATEVSSLGGHALAYDWVHETIDDPTAIERKLGTCAQRIAGPQGLRGNGPHLWHGYTSQAAALALAALALDDTFEGRDALLIDARELFRETALEAYEVVGGAWPEGYSYLRTHFFSGDPPNQYVIDALRAWDSAVVADSPDHASVFETIASEEGDWLRGLAYHLVYGTLPGYGPEPKKTLGRGGDMPTGQAYPNRQVRPYVDAVARVYGDPILAAWGRSLEAEWPFVGGSGTYHPVHRYALPLDLPMDLPAARLDDLPPGRIWSPAELGHVIARSGWSNEDAVIGYRAGKWFTGHQHADQGHIDIWRRGPLAVDGGVYAGWGSEHREAYYMRTAAHNTLVVCREGETFHEHPSLQESVNDCGQRIVTYTGCAQCMQSVAEWRSHVGAGLHFEAGRIDAYEDAGAYTVVASDLTAAYNTPTYASAGNEPKVEVVQRDLAYLRPDLLVVVDRVRTVTGSGSPPEALWHLPTRPAIADATVVAGTADNGIVAAASGDFTVDNGTGGRLAVRALHPSAVLRAVGGPDYRYFVDGANRSGSAAPHEGAPAEPGLWTVRASSASGGELLVHALTITNTEGSPWEPVTAERLQRFEARGVAPAVGVVLAHHDRQRVVVRSGAVPRGAVAFADLAVPAGPIELLLADLTPGAVYRIVRPGAPDVDARAGRAGALWLGSAGGDRLVVARCPADPGASAAWRAACDGSGPAARLALPWASGAGAPSATPPAGRRW